MGKGTTGEEEHEFDNEEHLMDHIRHASAVPSPLAPERHGKAAGNDLPESNG